MKNERDLKELRMHLYAEAETRRILEFEQVKQRMKDTGFVVGGRNETSVIRGLTQVNGIPIAELERIMRDDWKPTPEGIEDFKETIIESVPPDGYGYRTLNKYWGLFLGPEESLIDLLADDNDTVLGLGLTHQQLADFLDSLMPESSARYEKTDFVPANKSGGNPLGVTTVNGEAYYVEGVHHHYGGEESPFRDGWGGSKDFFVTRIRDGLQIQFGSMQPELIRRWGFYEGKQTAYRIDPRKLAEFAGLIPEMRS